MLLEIQKQVNRVMETVRKGSLWQLLTLKSSSYFNLGLNHCCYCCSGECICLLRVSHPNQVLLASILCAAINTMTRKATWEGRVIWLPLPGTSLPLRHVRAGTWNRKYGGALLTGLLPLPCSGTFLSVLVCIIYISSL